jgi:Ca2+-binding EF-hand superfamily protein
MRNTILISGLAAALALTGSITPSFAGQGKHNPERRAERMMKRLDTNGDGKVSLDEVHAQASAAFKTFDADGNGEVTRDEIKVKRQAFREVRKEWRAARDKTGAEKTAAMEKVKAMRPAMLPGMGRKGFKHADADKNGSLSLAEVTEQAGRMFKRRDKNNDGVLDAADFTRKI